MADFIVTSQSEQIKFIYDASKKQVELIQELKIEVPYNEGVISFLLSNLKMSSKFKLNENINFTFNATARKLT